MSLVIEVLIVEQHHLILAGNCLESYLTCNKIRIINFKWKMFGVDLPMRLGDTGADLGIPKGALKF